MLIGKLNGKKLSVSLTLFSSLTTIWVVAEDECSSNADCYADELVHLVCCRDSYDSERKCTQHNCAGSYCGTDGDCSRSECCINNAYALIPTAVNDVTQKITVL